MSGRRWTRADYDLDAATLAERLLGARLVHCTASGRRVSGIIVETEAYLGAPDLASHAVGGRRTKRNEVMYAGAGRAYVYFIYGMHHCFNVVCGGEHTAHAVLVRALRPDEGIELMRRRRGAEVAERLLCAGPGRLCRAMGIDLRQNGMDLVGARGLFVEDAAAEGAIRAVRTARIGVGYAGEWASKPLRWVVAGDRHASRRAG